MKIKCGGYLVLRKPEYNFDEIGRGAFLKKAPKLNDIYYGGIDRMQWFDVDEDFYSEKLPSKLIEIRKNIIENSSVKNDIKICSDFDDAIELLKYSNKNKIRNEIYVIDSISLENYIKAVEVKVGEKAIGCDLYCEGYGSIIKEGIFKKPELFKDFKTEINENGIFDIENKSISKYIDTYISLSEENVLEKMPGPINSIFIYTIL